MGEKRRSKSTKKKEKSRVLLKAFIGLILLILLGVVLTVFFNFDAGKVALFIVYASFGSVFLGVGLFVVINNTRLLSKAIGTADKYDEESKPNRDEASSFKGEFRPPLINTPIPYHVSLVVLTLISLLFFDDRSSIVSAEYYLRFVDDLVFQIVSTVLFVILGLFNPFADVTENLKELITNKQGFWYRLVSDTNKFILFRVAICLFSVAYFIYKEWLVFPSFNTDNPVLVGVTVTLLLFVAKNLYLMRRHPRDFIIGNLDRFMKLATLIHSAFFLILPLGIITMLASVILEGDENIFHLMPFLFIAFNLLVIYIEYSLIKENRT